MIFEQMFCTSCRGIMVKFANSLKTTENDGILRNIHFIAKNLEYNTIIDSEQLNTFERYI
jgi:hypothetical protein